MNIWSLFRGCDLPRPKSAIITPLCESAQTLRGITIADRAFLKRLMWEVLTAPNEQERSSWANTFVAHWSLLSRQGSKGNLL